MPAGPQVFFLRLKTDPTAGGEGLRRNEGFFQRHSRKQGCPRDPHKSRDFPAQKISQTYFQIRLFICLAFTQMFLKNGESRLTVTDNIGASTRHRRLAAFFSLVFYSLSVRWAPRHWRARGIAALGFFHPAPEPDSARAQKGDRPERHAPSRLHHPGGGVLRSDRPSLKVLLSVNRPRPRGFAPRAGSSARGRDGAPVRPVGLPRCPTRQRPEPSQPLQRIPRQRARVRRDVPRDLPRGRAADALRHRRRVGAQVLREHVRQLRRDALPLRAPRPGGARGGALPDQGDRRVRPRPVHQARDPRALRRGAGARRGALRR